MNDEPVREISVKGNALPAARLSGVALLVVFAPWAELKLLLLTVLAGGLLARLDTGVAFRAHHVRRILIGLGLLGLVVSPYWSIAPTPAWRIVGFIANVAVVVIWSIAASSDLRFNRSRVSRAGWVVAAATLLVGGFSLFGPFEFRGDEDVHINRPLKAVQALGALSSAHPGWLAIAASLGVLLIMSRGFWGQRARLALLIGLPVVAAVFFVANPPLAVNQLRLARYPLLGSWLQSLLAVSPLDVLPELRGAAYQETLYRLLSFCAVLLLSLMTVRVAKGTLAFRGMVAVMVGTAPTVQYFGGTGYTDLAGAALATAGLLALYVRTRRGLRETGAGSSSGPLLAIAVLVKESLAPFMAAVVVCTTIATQLRAGSTRSLLFRRSARLGLTILAPAATYIGWRLLAEKLLVEGKSMRGFGLDVSALLNPATAYILVTAWLVQFGPLLVLAATALILSRRRRPMLVLLVLPALAQIFFFNVEFVNDLAWGRLPLYAGFARYQLTLLPSIYVLSILGLREIWRRAPKVAWITVIMGLVWNVAASPVRIDRGRTAFWGDYVTETSGERYPYDQLYEWMSARSQAGALVIVGRDYSYRDDFYLERNRLAWTITSLPAVGNRSPLILAGGPSETGLVRDYVDLIQRASALGRPIVVHQSAWLRADSLPSEIGLLQRTRTFCLGAHCLLIYERVH